MKWRARGDSRRSQLLLPFRRSIRSTGTRHSRSVGMIGMRLETEMYLATIGLPAQNLRRSVEKGRYGVRELVVEPLAQRAVGADRG